MVLGGRSFGRWWVLGNGINVFIRKTQRDFLPPATMWDSATWKRALSWPCWLPDLGLPASKTVRNTFLFINYPVCDNLLEQSEWTDTEYREASREALIVFRWDWWWLGPGWWPGLPGSDQAAKSTFWKWIGHGGGGEVGRLGVGAERNRSKFMFSLFLASLLFIHLPNKLLTEQLLHVRHRVGTT